LRIPKSEFRNHKLPESINPFMQISILLTTVAKKSDARRLATTALQHRVAACIQIISDVESHFIWKDKKSACREFLVLAKTTTRKLKSLETLWKKIHPYDCPELITLSGRAAGSYSRWLQASVSR
jgi:periplasmic divalent cation tolerance protein